MNSQQTPIENKSMVANLMAQIQDEYYYYMRAIDAFLQGSSKHEVITMKQERIAIVFIEMGKKYGDDVAMQVMASLPPDKGPTQ